MKSAVKSSKVNRAWLNDHVNDTYVKLAQKDGYRARAAYKLKEIDETLHLIKPGQLVVDLGSTPGAWSQYVRRKLAPKSASGGGAARPTLMPNAPTLVTAVRLVARATRRSTAATAVLTAPSGSDWPQRST